jgi:hypothetical protein
MHSPLFVRASHYQTLPGRTGALEPRERFVRYHQDLHRAAGARLDPQSIVTGDQYTYAELADSIFDRAGADIGAQLDVLVTSYWTPEFDPEYPALGPYLQHRWSLDCPWFDVTDQGSIAPVLALSVLKDHLTADQCATEGLLLGVEQSTVPQAVGAHAPIPQRSSAGLLRLSRDSAGARAEILTADYLNEAQIVGTTFRLQDLLGDLCETFQLCPKATSLVMRRNTYLYRAFQYWKTDDACRLCHLPPQHSCMNLFYWMSRLLSDDSSAGATFLFVDEDVESLAAAVVLVRTL